MAWNPSPEVAVARDAAKRLADIHKLNVDRVIVLYTTGTGMVGYASYGQTKELCADARRIADRLFDTLGEIMEDE